MAAKKESTFINMLLTLFIVSLVASSALALVYKATKVPIDKAKLKKKEEAIKKIVPPFANKPIAEMYKIASDLDSLECYPAKDDKGNLIGVAIKTNTMLGFSGEFVIMVGFKPDGTIISTSVLEHKETPGLGDKIEKKKSDWSKKFEGKNPATNKISVTKDGGEIDAITASTITSRAFCDAILRAHQAYLKGGKK